ncbi:hypothetical protein HF086_014424 [Spodoptera exigua]|uniref:tyrosinase n=1 Tax=Spodoptera exigua TaxID=7107 RepID=A0A922MQN5_SPOEX|nr:hypothetical protein HF086_014424 [Spodoptera exigua]
MSDPKKNLLLFFDRPSEPCFMQKGDEKAVFEIPEHYYPEKYKQLTSTIANRFGDDAGRTIPVRNIALPNLTLPMELPYNEQFSLFVPKHRVMAGKLIDIFMGMRDLEDLQSVCSFCQLRINPYMFNYCLSVAILHRPDTKGINIPTFAETFPDKFMDPKVFRKAREVSNVVTSGVRMPVTIPVNYTANDSEPEQRVAYFREDIGINLHHWHWHLVYPFDSADRSIVNKDRRGELYNMERMCNGLSRVVRFQNFREPIEEGYFPKLDSQVASRAWPPRFAGTTIRDLDRPVDQIRADVSQLETWRDRFVQAVETLSVTLPNGRQIPLDEERGIDMLGNMMESSIISPNRGYYGDLHNMGHVFISYSHDPDHRHLEQFGVMGDSATAMRDPVFYRWHSYIDDLFQLYKYKLNPYGDDKSVMGTVRIFMAPVQDERGAPLTFDEQRRAMIELDKFTAGLRPGNNTIRHRSVDSSVTIPYERTFRDQSARPGDPGTAESAEFDFCGCGWPHHMLIAKGNPQGYPVVLFAMVSNWAEDRIEQDLVGSCNDAASYCGIRDRKYPDRRAMGFPFDRPSTAQSLSDFLRPNMAVQNCSIRFSDTTIPRQQRR